MTTSKIGQVKIQDELALLDLILPRDVGLWLDAEAARQKITARQLVKRLLVQIYKGTQK